MGKIHHLLPPRRKAKLAVNLRIGDILFITSSDADAKNVEWEHAAIVAENVRKGSLLESVMVWEMPWEEDAPLHRVGLTPKPRGRAYSHKIRGKQLGHEGGPWNMGGRVLPRAKAETAVLDYIMQHHDATFHSSYDQPHLRPKEKGHKWMDCVEFVSAVYQGKFPPEKGQRQVRDLLKQEFDFLYPNPYTGQHPSSKARVKPAPSGQLDLSADQFAEKHLARPTPGHLAKAIVSKIRPWKPVDLEETNRYALASRVYHECLGWFTRSRRFVRNFFTN